MLSTKGAEYGGIEEVGRAKRGLPRRETGRLLAKASEDAWRQSVKRFESALAWVGQLQPLTQDSFGGEDNAKMQSMNGDGGLQSPFLFILEQQGSAERLT